MNAPMSTESAGVVVIGADRSPGVESCRSLSTRTLSAASIPRHALPNSAHTGPVSPWQRELVEQMHEMAEAALEGSQGRVVVLHGPPGVGKTRAAVQLLEREAAVEGFVDGLLYAPLGARTLEPMDPISVLRGFLSCLGAPETSLPDDLAGLVAAYRSSTQGRRLALLLDDALSAAQVRTLFPGQGPHLVVVTTRHLLSALRLDGARFISFENEGKS